MKKFAYIVAYLPTEDDTALAFRHMFLEARSLDHAYTMGMQHLDDTISGKLVNNYVIELT